MESILAYIRVKNLGFYFLLFFFPNYEKFLGDFYCFLPSFMKLHHFCTVVESILAYLKESGIVFFTFFLLLYLEHEILRRCMKNLRGIVFLYCYIAFSYVMIFLNYCVVKTNGFAVI